MSTDALRLSGAAATVPILALVTVEGMRRPVQRAFLVTYGPWLTLLSLHLASV